mgnify:CR=1 FL=1
MEKSLYFGSNIKRHLDKALFLFFTIAGFNFAAQAQTYKWAKSMGSTSNDYGKSIDVDNNGNVITVGKFAATVDFDPNSGVMDLSAPGSNGITDVYTILGGCSRNEKESFKTIKNVVKLF